MKKLSSKKKNEKVAKGHIIGLAGPCSHRRISLVRIQRDQKSHSTVCPLFAYLNDLGSFVLGYIKIPARSLRVFGPVTISTTALIVFLSFVTLMKSRRGRHWRKPGHEQ